MGQAIAVRSDYTSREVRRFAKQSNDVWQARRLLAIAAVLEGASREEAAKIGGMERQTLRDWVIRFNDEGPEGLSNKPSPGAPCKLHAEHKEFLARLIDEGPNPALAGLRSGQTIARSVRSVGIGCHGLPGPEGIGFLACERPAQGLQAGSPSH